MGAGQFLQPVLTSHESLLHSLNAAQALRLRGKKSVLFTFEDNSIWTLSSGAGTAKADDTTNFKTGSKALKLTANAVNCQVDATQSANVTGKHLELTFYVDSAANLLELDVLLDASSNWTKYFAGGIKGTALKDGWNTISLYPPTFALQGTATLADLAAIKRWRLKVQPQSGLNVNVSIDQMRVVTKQLPRGKVTLTFDDGHDTVYTEAKPRMDAYGMQGVSYVITSQVGNASRMTLAQLQNLRDLGWDISSHTKTHKLMITDAPTAAQIRDELLGSKQWLIANGFQRSAQHFATPGGEFNAAILAEIKKYYSTHRTILEKTEDYPVASPHTLKIHNIFNYTTLATVQSWIDQAAAKKQWLILLMHYIVDPADESTKITPTMFQSIVDYLAAADVDVVTMTDMLADDGSTVDAVDGLVFTDTATGTLYRLVITGGAVAVEAV